MGQPFLMPAAAVFQTVFRWNGNEIVFKTIVYQKVFCVKGIGVLLKQSF